MLSIKQKSWIAHERGKQWVLSHQSNSKEPASKIEVIVVKANPYISKMYCQDCDDLGVGKPVCFSLDGVAPAEDVLQPLNKTCVDCPQNRGRPDHKQGGGCQDYRRIAVAPRHQPDSPILLRVPCASLKSLAAFGHALVARGINHTDVATLITINCSAKAKAGELKFEPTAFLTPDAIDHVEKAADSEVVEAILTTSEFDIWRYFNPESAPLANNHDVNSLDDQAEADSDLKQLYQTVERVGLKATEVAKLLNVSRIAYYKWRTLQDRVPHSIFMARIRMLIKIANESAEKGLLPLPALPRK